MRMPLASTNNSVAAGISQKVSYSIITKKLGNTVLLQS